MLRHGTTIGSFAAGDAGLEANVAGRWQAATFKRPMLLVFSSRAPQV